MNPDLTSNENEQNSVVDSQASDAREKFEEAKALASATLAGVDSAISARFVADIQAFEEAESQLEAAVADRDEVWRVLPKDVQKALAKTLQQTSSDSSALSFAPDATNVPLQTLAAAAHAQRKVLQIREVFYKKRSECRAPLIDCVLSTDPGYKKFYAPFPAAEFESRASILLDLRLCESLEEALKKAELRWKTDRPCVAANFQQKVTKERKSWVRSIKREMYRDFAHSPDWKAYARSFAAIWRSILFSTLGVVALWGAILKWRLVYFLRFESIFPYKSDAYRFLFFMTPVVWIALAYWFRNVVLFRIEFNTRFKKFNNFKKDMDAAIDARDD